MIENNGASKQEDNDKAIHSMWQGEAEFMGYAFVMTKYKASYQRINIRMQSRDNKSSSLPSPPFSGSISVVIVSKNKIKSTCMITRSM